MAGDGEHLQGTVIERSWSCQMRCKLQLGAAILAVFVVVQSAPANLICLGAFGSDSSCCGAASKCAARNECPAAPTSPTQEGRCQVGAPASANQARIERLAGNQSVLAHPIAEHSLAGPLA